MLSVCYWVEVFRFSIFFSVFTFTHVFFYVPGSHSPINLTSGSLVPLSITVCWTQWMHVYYGMLRVYVRVPLQHSWECCSSDQHWCDDKQRSSHRVTSIVLYELVFHHWFLFLFLSCALGLTLVAMSTLSTVRFCCLLTQSLCKSFHCIMRCKWATPFRLV